MTTRLVCLAVGFGCTAWGQFRSIRDIKSLPKSPAIERVSYGESSEQYAELRVPEGAGPHPVAIVIHGGCWGEFADASFMNNFSTVLSQEGIATWNLEYRRVHQPGGGWPGTFQDVAAGIDSLRRIASKHRLDLSRVVAVGHSSGGHLAVWAAARKKLAKDSPLYVADPLPLRGVVSLGGVVDLNVFVDYGRMVCGERHIRLMGGLPAEHPDRYRQGSPAALLPLGVPQRFIFGKSDRAVPAHLFKAYEEAARKGGDDVSVTVLARSAHFDMLAPQTENWAVMDNAVREIVGLKPRP
jgi:acetyl esterase/lipase